jgi:signal transduction histidine kinase
MFKNVTRGRAPATPQPAFAAPGAESWMVFGMRVVLAVSALLTLYVGPAGVVLAGRWSWLIFVAYTLHSLTLLGIVTFHAGFRHGTAVYWVDVGWYALMVVASGGAPSPFFSFYFYAILAASFRHGFDAGARLTLGSAAAITAAVLATPGAHPLHMLLLRATFVLALGYMIAFWGGLAVDQRRRLALLRDVSSLSNPRFGVQHTLDSLLDKILRFYGGVTCVLLMRDGAGRWTLTTAHHPATGRAIGRSRTEADAVQPLLDLDEGATLLYRRARALQLAAGEGAWRPAPAGACGHVADLLDAPGFISAALPLRKGAGRIFVTGDHLRRADAAFLSHIVQQAFPVIETIELLDRLASDAAFRERQTIARDLHDSTIQPYIGLRHAVAAIRMQAGDASSLAPDLDRLLHMCTGVIADMREFAHRFRHGRQEEPELLIALRRQLNQVRAFYAVDVTLEAQAAAINDRMAAQVFQIVTEGVSNICKHTRARSARVVLADVDGQCAIDIVNPHEDDRLPPPFTPASIAERVHGLGGQLHVDTTAHETRLRIRLPN